RALPGTPDPPAQWADLNALSGGAAPPGRALFRRPRPAGAPDHTPPLPPDQLAEVLASYDRLRRQKPEWLTSSALTNVLTELKRARRVRDEERVYRGAVEAANQVAVVLQVLA